MLPDTVGTRCRRQPEDVPPRVDCRSLRCRDRQPRHFEVVARPLVTNDHSR